MRKLLNPPSLPDSSKLLAVLGSPKFFTGIIILLTMQSLWIALTSGYPQAFDENFHFGLIQLHAQQWLPFFTHQPAGAEIYGAVVRDPSYLYHYLFSLPYRLISAVTDSLAAQVIVLRLLNIGLFVWGMYVARRLLVELGASRRMLHVVLMFFVLTPIVPLLAAQINYDNLVFPLTVLMFVATIRLLKQLHTKSTFSLNLLSRIILYGMLASLVKYSFSPILLATVALILIELVIVTRKKHSSPLKRLDFHKNLAAWVIIGLLVITVGLFVERYAVNLAIYHTPVPDCAKVLTVDQCSKYSPWARDYQFARTYPRPSTWGTVVYPGVWTHRMVFETMFSIGSKFWPDGVSVEYYPNPPLTVANYTAWTIVVVGVITSLVFVRRLWGMVYLRTLLLVIAFYTFVLFIKNFAMYMHSGEAVAIHGRYLIPVYPVLYLMLALGFKWFLEHFRRPQFKVWLVVVTTLLFLQGAGLVVWIARSEPTWYWQQSPQASRINWLAQQTLRYIVVK